MERATHRAGTAGGTPHPPTRRPGRGRGQVWEGTALPLGERNSGQDRGGARDPAGPLEASPSAPPAPDACQHRAPSPVPPDPSQHGRTGPSTTERGGARQDEASDNPRSPRWLSCVHARTHARVVSPRHHDKPPCRHPPSRSVPSRSNGPRAPRRASRSRPTEPRSQPPSHHEANTRTTLHGQASRPRRSAQRPSATSPAHDARAQQQGNRPATPRPPCRAQPTSKTCREHRAQQHPPTAIPSQNETDTHSRTSIL